MRIKLFWACFAFLFCLSLPLENQGNGWLFSSNSSKNSKPPKNPTKATKTYTIVIDPGHGGKDPGAISRIRFNSKTVFEKNITLQVAKILKQTLEKSNKRYRVLLTRKGDQFISLKDRVNFTRLNKADLFISLHADNSLRNANLSGLAVYTRAQQASHNIAAKLAKHENAVEKMAGNQGYHHDPTINNILFNMLQRENQNLSKQIARNLVVLCQKNQLKTMERPQGAANFWVLCYPDIPAILIEMGFLSNMEDLRRLHDPKYHQKLSNAIRILVEQQLSN